MFPRRPERSRAESIVITARHQTSFRPIFTGWYLTSDAGRLTVLDANWAVGNARFKCLTALARLASSSEPAAATSKSRLTTSSAARQHRYRFEFHWTGRDKPVQCFEKVRIISSSECSPLQGWLRCATARRNAPRSFSCQLPVHAAPRRGERSWSRLVGVSALKMCLSWPHNITRDRQTNSTRGVSGGDTLN